METKFKVVTKRSVKSVKDFILFVYRARYPRMTGHFIFVGVLLIGLPFFVGVFRQKEGLANAMLIIGILSLLMGFFRQYIATLRTLQNDEAYKEGWELSYQFTQRGIFAYRNGEMEKNVGAYNHVTAMYTSEDYFYLEIDQEEMYVLPVKDFVEGNAEEFEEFITSRSNVEVKWYPTGLKNKFQKWKQNDKVAVEQQQKMLDDYNAERARKKAERKKRRENK